MAVAAPRKPEAIVEKCLAHLDDALLAHGEQVVDENDMAHVETDEIRKRITSEAKAPPAKKAAKPKAAKKQ